MPHLAALCQQIEERGPMKDVSRLGRERQEASLVGRPARLVIAGMELDLLGALTDAVPCVQTGDCVAGR